MAYITPEGTRLYSVPTGADGKCLLITAIGGGGGGGGGSNFNAGGGGGGGGGGAGFSANTVVTVGPTGFIQVGDMLTLGVGAGGTGGAAGTGLNGVNGGNGEESFVLKFGFPPLILVSANGGQGGGEGFGIGGGFGGSGSVPGGNGNPALGSPGEGGIGGSPGDGMVTGAGGKGGNGNEGGANGTSGSVIVTVVNCIT